MRNILITGGCGFIGSNFVRMAIGGHFPDIERVTVLDNLSYAGNLENLKSVENQIEFIEGEPQYQTVRAGDLVTIPKKAFHSTMNNGWEPVKILAVYSPAGVESGMRTSTDFKRLPAGVVPARRPPPC